MLFNQTCGFFMFLDKIVAFYLKMPISSNCPIYCGKTFPHIKGKLSRAVGNLFPSSRESFPTICGTKTLYMETYKRNT